MGCRQVEEKTAEVQITRLCSDFTPSLCKQQLVYRYASPFEKDADAFQLDRDLLLLPKRTRSAQPEGMFLTQAVTS